MRNKQFFKFKIVFKKTFAVYMALTLFFEVAFPSASLALTGGPSQPEVQSFEPVGTSEMVDPFSGDFSYNIPLMDVDGYPVNISYHSNITMDQEASWTGLGWNVNPGVINRGMRGLPDDFMGENITKEINMKPNTTFGITTGADVEFLGADGSSLGGVSYGLAIKFNNYTGVGVDQTLGGHIPFSTGGGTGGTASLGITSSSSSGLSLQPNLSFSAQMQNEEGSSVTLGLSVGANFNSRAGLSQVTIGASASFKEGAGNSESGNPGMHDLSKSAAAGDADGNVAGGGGDAGGGGGGPAVDYGVGGGGDAKMDYGMGGGDAELSYASAGGGGDGGGATGSINNGSEGGGGSSRSMHFSKGVTATYNIGMPTFTPQLTLPFQNLSISSNFKLGGEVFGLYLNGDIGGFYSTQTLITKTVTHPAYGYLFADQGVRYDNALMDFNREKDVPFTANSTPALPVTNFTYDLLSVSGQGIGGSYRPFRNDFGHVFDPHVSNTSWSGSLGLEIGLGELFKVGVDVALNNVTSQSGQWNNSDGSNDAYTDLYFTQNSPDPTYEKYYYKEANEKSVDSDPTFLQRTGGYQPEAYGLDQLSKFHTVNTGYFAAGGKATGTRNGRAKRTTDISMLQRGEMSTYALLKDPQLFPSAKAYHTGEITSVTPEGKRYVYGIAAYNTRQEETTFGIGQDEFNSGGYTPSTDLDSYTGLVKYPGGSNSTSNTNGIDNFFSNTIMPPYAHAYFLTAVLSSDYVDVDTIRGPSANDLGTYTKFNYVKKNSAYKWRVPCEANTGSFNEGLKWTQQDDKANYIYGTKELWYLSSIETKNYIAVFSIDQRKDGFGVNGKDGGINSGNPMYKLNTISLYTKANYNANQANSSIALIPIKEVHFTYDYSLCQGIPNSIPSGGGKLTLREISFSYQSSQKGRLSPYKFNYSSTNPNYNIKGYDRWGNYKPQDVNLMPGHFDNENPGHQGISNAEFPYVRQDSKPNQDAYASAWALTQIGLPSGGMINVDYESDDYAYVQNKQACQMFKIVGVSTSPTSLTSAPTTAIQTSTLPLNSYLVIQLQTPITGANPNQQFYNKYLNGLNYIYFRFLYNMSNANGATYEYVPGYIPISMLSGYGVYPYSGSGPMYAYIQMSGVPRNDNGITQCYPIEKAALQYGRLNEPKNMWDQPAGFNSNSNFGLSILQAFIQSSFVNNISDAVLGPNEALYTKHNCCQNFYLNKSWIRLNSPNMQKLGGGSRVKKISISDQWSGMTGSAMPSFSYGQEYFYTNEDGTSSGVASYEPQIGEDENPWRTPVFYDITHLLAPNDRMYLEEPFGECFFPSPSVGYGRVTVQNIKYSGVTKHATGNIIHKFWTSKDFPTITSRTNLENNVSAFREKTDPLSLSSFLHIDSKDYMTASMGYYVELNDMNGKPKGQEVYQEGVSVPISSIEYDYLKVPYSTNSYQLSNAVQTVDPTGNISSQDVGVTFDFVGDFREEKTNTIGGTLNFNTDAMDFGFIVLPIPTIWPGFSSEKNRFRSSVVTKVFNRSGILKSTTAKDLGSTVETDNLAYDSETGGVILTKTTTDYNDAIYTLNYPAYWYYDGMGPAYKNVGISMPSIPFSTGTGNIANASSYFVPGDEIEMNSSSGQIKAWLLSVSNTSITVEEKDGTQPPNGTYNIKIIRSGRKNRQSANMATITSLQNPLSGINNNVYNNVIHASGKQFNEQWSVFCDCISNYHGADPSVSYVTGGKGNWRVTRDFAYLTSRTQSSIDNNTNIRKDGVYTSYNPLYKKAGAKWQFDTTNWTFKSKVTIINPNGEELENQDALGRYSAATYNYNQTLATAVSANSRFREIGFDNVEAYSKNCADDHFTFSNPRIDSTISHTGRKSLRVSSSSPTTMMKILNVPECPAVPFCDIAMAINGGKSTAASSGGNNYVFTGTGAVAPLTMSWQISNGTPSIGITKANQITVTATGSWSAVVTITGATGCSEKFIIGNNTSMSGGGGSTGTTSTRFPVELDSVRKRIVPH